MGTSVAARGLRAVYAGARDISPDGTHSQWWTAETGYTSANPIHSMLASAKDLPHLNKWVFTQKHSWDVMTDFVKAMLKDAVKQLRAEKDATTDTANWLTGIKRIGSVLHTMQDSACACTPKHWTLYTQFTGTYKIDKAVKDCIEGDGHGVLAKHGGRYVVTGLSDGIFYDQRHDYHAKLDQLYNPQHVLSIAQLLNAHTRPDINDLYEADPKILFGDNDPAYDGANLIQGVLDAIDTVTDPAVVAAQLTDLHFIPRFVGRLELRMPTIAASQTAKQHAQQH